MVTRMVASRATINKTIARTIMIVHSPLSAFHSELGSEVVRKADQDLQW